MPTSGVPEQSHKVASEGVEYEASLLLKRDGGVGRHGRPPSQNAMRRSSSAPGSVWFSVQDEGVNALRSFVGRRGDVRRLCHRHASPIDDSRVTAGDMPDGLYGAGANQFCELKVL